MEVRPTLDYSKPLPGHCEGCDQYSLSIRPYLARFSDEPEKWVEVFYCPECALLAEVNWNGETLEIKIYQEN